MCTDLTESFPRVIAIHLADLIQLSIHVLSNVYPFFYSHQISTDSYTFEPPSSTSDTGRQVDFDDLPSDIFEFLYTAMNREKGLAFLKTDQGAGLLKELVRYQIDYCQITAEQVISIFEVFASCGPQMLTTVWQANVWDYSPDAFMEDFADDEGNDTLKDYSLDLLSVSLGSLTFPIQCSTLTFSQSLIEKVPQTISQILQAAIRERVEQSVDLRNRGDADWWKPVQAALALTGGIAEDLVDLKDGASFDLHYLFEHVIPDLVGQTGKPSRSCLVLHGC